MRSLLPTSTAQLLSIEGIMKENTAKKKKHPFFKFVKAVVRIFKRKQKVVYLGDKVEKSSLILSNHVGASGPMSWELYPEFSFRFWGTYQMNGNLKMVYQYLSVIYFHQKKHWPLWLSRIFCLIAAPVMKGIYRGLEVISTYPDVRLKSTITTSLQLIEEGHNIIIFPEDSSVGYFDQMTRFFAGFLFFAKICYKHGHDVPIFVSYYHRKKNTTVIDKPIRYTELLEKYKGLSDMEISKILLDRCNQLGEEIQAGKYK